MGIIELTSISKIYGFGDAATTALDNVSLSVKKGEFVAVMGPSGSGKSTLMHIMGLLDRPTAGTYDLDGRAVSGIGQRERARVRREKIGFIFQSFNLLPRLSVIENVAMPLTYAGSKYGPRMKAAEKLLKEVGLEDRQFYQPNQLSGGQTQRVAVARALVNKPAILLADEPTGNLDTVSSTKIMELLKSIHKKGNTIIMVTHNPELAAYATRVINMRDGKIESDTAKQKTRSKKQETKKAVKKKPAKKKAAKK